MAHFTQAHDVRPAAVAGQFYPANPNELSAAVQGYLSDANPVGSGRAKAIIAPHAGYIYSGPIAGSAYQAIRHRSDQIRRVVLIGPSHRVAFTGIALSSKTHFQTPLGDVPLDQVAQSHLLNLPFVGELDAAHAEEHGLEVHLPFLQEFLGDFQLVPIVVGDANTEEVAAVLETVWGGDETLIVVSSDLSHFLDYPEAQRVDADTSSAIVRLDPAGVTNQGACGAKAVRGLLQIAQNKGLTCRLLDLRNSGDTAGGPSRVVGYGAYSFEANPV